MPRDNDDRYEDDFAPPPKPRPNTVLYVVLAVFGVVLLTCIGGPLLLTFLWADMANRDRQAQQEIAQRAEAEAETSAKAEAIARKAKAYPRDEFRDLVMGKTEGEVLDRIGDPDRKEDKGADDLTYFYDQKTLDPTTGKTDASIVVKFKFGRVDSVRHGRTQ